MRSFLGLLLLPSLACSTSSSHAGLAEAGLDAPADVTDDSCFPYCSSGSSSSGGGNDGGDASCSDLKNTVESLQSAARACNPSAENQCTGTAQGLCCPITVSAGNDQAANNLEDAITNYKSQCDAACLTIICPNTPSDDCVGTGNVGACQ
jgi:hypothetical protein